MHSSPSSPSFLGFCLLTCILAPPQSLFCSYTRKHTEAKNPNQSQETHTQIPQDLSTEGFESNRLPTYQLSPPQLSSKDHLRAHLHTQPTHSLLLLSERQQPVRIAYVQYDRYLKADNMIRITAICKVTDEAEVVVERDVILDNPTLTLEVRGWDRLPPLRPLS